MNPQAQDSNAGQVRRIQALSRPLDPLPALAQPSLKRLPEIRAILFDIYGTLLVSSSGDIGAARKANREDALREALAAAGFSGADRAAGETGVRLLDQNIAEAHAARRREGIEHPEVEIREIWRSVIEGILETKAVQGPIGEESVCALAVEYECRVNPVWPMPHLKETVDALHGSGRKLGVVSNAQFYTPLTLSAFPETGWGDGRFDPGLCVWSYKLREAKPSERLVQTALRRLEESEGIKPSEVLCVGNDMLNDISPAARLGCRTALFAGDRRSFRLREGDPRVAGINPDLVVTDLLQLVQALVRVA